MADPTKNRAGIDSGNCGAPFKIMDARLHGHEEKSHRKRKRRSGPAGLLLLHFFLMFWVWCLDLSAGCLELSFGCLELSVGCLDLSVGCLDLSVGCLDLSSGCLDLSFGLL